MTKYGRLAKYMLSRRAMRKQLRDALEPVWDCRDERVVKPANYIFAYLDTTAWVAEDIVWRFVIHDKPFDADVYIRNLEKYHSELLARYAKFGGVLSGWPEAQNKLKEYIDSYPQFFSVMRRAAGLDKKLVKKAIRKPRIVHHLPAIVRRK